MQRVRLGADGSRFGAFVRKRWGLLLAGVLSALLHGVAVWTMLPQRTGRGDPVTPPPIEIEMVTQPTELKGRPALDPPSAPTPAPPPPPQAAAAPPAPATLPVETTATLPPPLRPGPIRPAPPDAQPRAETPPESKTPPTETPPDPTPPAPDRPATPPGPQADPSSVYLGNADEDAEGLFVTGRNVVPPRPDATVRNMPPHYPAEAARRGSQGVVSLRAHVSEVGVPSWVDIVQSSGDPSLDRAAQEAVTLWKFQPARQGGAAVPFTYDVDIRFTLGGRSAATVR